MLSSNLSDTNSVIKEHIWKYNEKGDEPSAGNSLFLITAIYCMCCLSSIPIIVNFCKGYKNRLRKDSSENVKKNHESVSKEPTSTQNSYSSEEHENDQDLPLLNKSNHTIVYSTVSITGQIVGEDIDVQQDLGDQDGSNRYDNKKRLKKSIILNVCYNLQKIARFDQETRSIMKLALPYTLKSIFESSLDIVTYALIGNYLGVTDLSAYAVAELLLDLSNILTTGIIDSTLTLVPYCMGNENFYLAGQYVQIATLMFTLLTIPAAIFWSIFIFDIIVWFGFDDNIATITQAYIQVRVYSIVLSGAPDIFSEFLDTTGFEVFSSTCTVIYAIVNTAVLLLFFISFDQMNLVVVAYIELGLTIIFGISIILIPLSKGWINDYINGLFLNIAFKNMIAVTNLLNIALPFTIGSIFTYGEWQALTIFAAHLGPQAVVAWAVLGSLWGLLETTTNEIGSSAEVRVGYHLGKGNPEMARQSANKVLFFGTCFGFVITFIFYFVGDKLAVWLTDDIIIQQMIQNSIPYMSLANITMVYGMLCWSISVSQGKYSLGTSIAAVSTWGIVIPTAALMIYKYNLSIECLVSAMLFGYVATGTVLTVFVLLTDWEKACQKIMTMNEENGYDDSSDCSSDDSDSMMGESLSSVISYTCNNVSLSLE